MSTQITKDVVNVATNLPQLLLCVLGDNSTVSIKKGLYAQA